MSLSIDLEIFGNVLSGIAEEMGVRLQRSAYSPNIKERLDFSCALFDRQGRLTAQAAHIPVHLGSMPMLVKGIVEKLTFTPGDVLISNDPFSGGTHLPDITLIEPLFAGERLWGFAAARAHHSDVGGITPGSMPLSTSIYQEGIIIPPLFLRKGGVPNSGLMELITRNTRTPAERAGDIRAQEAALATARERVAWMTETYGFDNSLALLEELLSYSERLTRTALGHLPSGTASAVDFMEEDGTGEPIPIRVMVNLAADNATVDFSGTSPQMENSLNAPLPVTLASVYYVFRCLLGDHIPANDGCFRPIQVRAPFGSIVNASSPSAVAAGNVETSQRIVDTLLLALSKIMPGLIPAASCGTMNNVTIGGRGGPAGKGFAYYETIGGGMGAGSAFPGLSAVHTHMTNTLNTPVEALESAFPFLVSRYGIRRGSGGAGRHRGGDGIIREYLFNASCHVTIISGRRKTAPYGLEGGEGGRPGVNRHFVNATGEMKNLGGRASVDVGQGDRIIIETPGGGGWGGTEDGPGLTASKAP
jgi:N-methylhydantoinase B